MANGVIVDPGGLAQVERPADNSPPALTLDTAGPYLLGAVPPMRCTATDPESGIEPSDGVTVINMPKHVSYFQAPLVYTVPLQLLAYHVAILKGTDVDQPRNLAKSVTVE